jgi:hypothetical protein
MVVKKHLRLRRPTHSPPLWPTNDEDPCSLFSLFVAERLNGTVAGAATTKDGA